MKFSAKIEVRETGELLSILAEETPLSKRKLKNCLIKGGVWLKRPGRKERRVRRSRFTLQAEDQVRVHYDETILNLEVAPPTLLSSCPHYSVWIKPAGMLSQGTRFGDHCSLLRFVEKEQPDRRVHLIHRLDREAFGLVLLAHGKKAAGALSTNFQDRRVEKKYLAWCHGQLAPQKGWSEIATPLDSKKAVTNYRTLHYNADLDRTLVEVDLLTGRYHQIRKHFKSIHHPLVGDLRYGADRNPEGLLLAAAELAFNCPFQKKEVRFRLPAEELSLFQVDPLPRQ